MVEVTRSEGLGVELTCQLIKAGNHDSPSRHVVMLTRNGVSYSTEYGQGAAYRKWTNASKFSARRDLAQHANPESFGPIRPGHKVKWNGGHLQSATIQEWFDRYTEPIEPELDSVLSCLAMDASCVRHGQSFEEFCGEFGYDEDSRKAECTFAGCRDNWTGLVRLGLDLDELDRMFTNF